MRSRLALLAAAAALATALGACGGDDDKKDEPAAGDTASPSARKDTRDAQADRIAKDKLQAAVGGYNDGYEKFFAKLKKAGDLDSLQAAISDYRDVIYEFDADIRAIEFSDELVPQVNSILENNRGLIAQLDAIGQAASFKQAQALYEEFLKDRTPQVKAINRLLDQLGGGQSGGGQSGGGGSGSGSDDSGGRGGY